MTKAALDYSKIQTLPELWPILAERYGDLGALSDPHRPDLPTDTFQSLSQKIQQFACGLQQIGVLPESKVAFFADNSSRWLVADQGIMAAGAVNVVRSATADPQELGYIFANSDSSVLIIETAEAFTRLAPALPPDRPIEALVVIFGEPPADFAGPSFTFEQILEKGTTQSLEETARARSSLATLLYTSGTTGKPKGVMLTHENLIHQLRAIPTILQPDPGDRALSILPTWHAYERTCEYFLLSRGCGLIYTNKRSFKTDLKKYSPAFMVGVPRLWELIYEGVQKQFRDHKPSLRRLISFFFSVSQRYIKARRIVQGLDVENLSPSAGEQFFAQIQTLLLGPIHALGDRLVYKQVRDGVGGNIGTLVSGGGALAKHVDDFFEVINITVVVGYGLTETSPVVTIRRYDHNLKGSSGRPLPETEVKIRDLDTGEILPTGKRGLVLLKGPQIMAGYYKLPEATAKAIDPDGWFDSGDLGWQTPQGDLVLTGRAKDTIVLSNGENIEPQPIEDACARSPYVDQIMLVGQDQKSIGALIVPNVDALQQWAAENQQPLNLPNLPTTDLGDLASASIRQLYKTELTREVKNRPGFRPDDRIGPFELVGEPFTIENGLLTQTLKVKRPRVYERYRDIIDEMFD
ncbi:MAG: AMP-binding protein [Cyanobacteria bacterium P01_H01_bin.15]